MVHFFALIPTSVIVRISNLWVQTLTETNSKMLQKQMFLQKKIRGARSIFQNLINFSGCNYTYINDGPDNNKLNEYTVNIVNYQF